MHEERVSVITAVRNGAKYLERTIRSVLEQDHGDIEYIVMDGQSTDGTLEIIRKYEDRLAHWSSGPDAGMYDAINKGLHKATGRYLAYLNADDLYLPHTVSAAVRRFRNQPECDLLYGDCDFIDAEDRPLYTYRYPAFRWDRFVSLDWMSIPQPTVFWRREVHDRCGYFDQTYRMAGDFEFFARASRSRKVAHVGQVLARFRLHGESLSARGAELNRKERARMIESMGLGRGLGWHFHRFWGAAYIRMMNAPLMAKKALGMVE